MSFGWLCCDVVVEKFESEQRGDLVGSAKLLSDARCEGLASVHTAQWELGSVRD